MLTGLEVGVVGMAVSVAVTGEGVEPATGTLVLGAEAPSPDAVVENAARPFP